MFAGVLSLLAKQLVAFVQFDLVPLAERETANGFDDDRVGFSKAGNELRQQAAEQNEAVPNEWMLDVCEVTVQGLLGGFPFASENWLRWVEALASPNTFQGWGRIAGAPGTGLRGERLLAIH